MLFQLACFYQASPVGLLAAALAPRADASHGSRSPSAQGPAPCRLVMPPRTPRPAPVQTILCWVLAPEILQLITCWSVLMNPPSSGIALSMTSPSMEKPPSSQAGGTASLGHRSCREGGQPGHSDTHCMVYPPFLLQEQLVFTVVIVQALVQEKKMLLLSSVGEVTPAAGRATLGPSPLPLHAPGSSSFLNPSPSPLKTP